MAPLAEARMTILAGMLLLAVGALAGVCLALLAFRGDRRSFDASLATLWVLFLIGFGGGVALVMWPFWM